MPTVDGIRITVTGDRVLEPYLAQLAARLQDLRPAMEDIGAALESAIQARFDRKADPAGAAWPPWAESTRRAYERTDGDASQGSLLERTGRMRASLSWEADATSVTVGFGVPYAAYHEFGTVRMPRRGLLAADPEAGRLGIADRGTVLEIVRKYLAPA